jgi:hypothetical protein
LANVAEDRVSRDSGRAVFAPDPLVFADRDDGCVTPHVARKSRHSTINGRTTSHASYALSQKHRKRIEEPFGWGKTVGGLAQTVYRGIERVGARLVLIMAASNLARLPRLLGA